MTKAKRIITLVLCLALTLLIGGEIILSALTVRTEAVESSGTLRRTDVLEDLEKDDSFNVDDYPDDPNNYGLEIITVAEGESGELYIYVYQPSNATKDLRASKINMSLQAPEDLNPEFNLYGLEWLSSNGVFDKYKVKDFTVTTEAYRYYTIATIYRSYDETIDDSAFDFDDIVDYEGIAVAKSWCCYYYNGKLNISSVTIHVADCTIWSVGYTRYYDGLNFDGSPSFYEYTDSHFVAFSVDNFNVEKIYNAEVAYVKQNAVTFSATGNGPPTEFYGETEAKEIFVNDDEAASEGGWFGVISKTSWNRISTVNEFITDIQNQTNEFISEEDEKNLSKAQFVFRFLETECTQGSGMTSAIQSNYTYIHEVTILRISFLDVNGKFYNLGVIADIVSDNGEPDYVVDALDNIQNSFEDIGALLLLMILLFLIFVFWDPIKSVLKVLWTGIKVILKIAFAIIKFPFKLIGSFFRGQK